MWTKFLNKLAALIDVKSLTTLALVVAFVILSITGVIAAESFLQIFLVVITYYFTKDIANGGNKDKDE